jgi:hypothetical protein
VLVEPSATPEPTLTPTETFTPAPTATETEIPTNVPTLEEGVEIVGEIFQNPQLKEDVKNVIVSPSPIDNPVEYAEWKKKLNEILLVELPNHQDKIVELDIGQVRIGFEKKSVKFSDAEWKAISAYKFDWNGTEVLTKVFPVSINGEVSLFHFTYSADDAMAYNSYEEPYSVEGAVAPRIFCSGEALIDELDFAKEILIEYTDEQFDSLRRVLHGGATKEDQRIVSEMEFVISSLK